MLLVGYTTAENPYSHKDKVKDLFDISQAPDCVKLTEDREEFTTHQPEFKKGMIFQKKEAKVINAGDVPVYYVPLESPSKYRECFYPDPTSPQTMRTTLME